jgi:hypothetical protein
MVPDRKADDLLWVGLARSDQLRCLVVLSMPKAVNHRGILKTLAPDTFTLKIHPGRLYKSLINFQELILFRKLN